MASSRLYGPSSAPQTPGGIVAANTEAPNAAPLPAKQSITGTAETVILNPAILTQPLLLNIPPGGPLEQRPFEISASGYITTTQSSTATLGLRIGTSTTAASNTAVASSGASAAIATTTVPFFFVVKAVYDSVSGKLCGYFTAVIQSSLLGPTAFTAVAASINNAATAGFVLNLVLTATFGTGTTANVINVQEFAVNF